MIPFPQDFVLQWQGTPPPRSSGSPMHFPAQLVDSPQLVGHLQIREFTPPGLQKMEELQMPSPHFSVVSSLPVSLS